MGARQNGRAVLARARFFLRPFICAHLFPSACYAGYNLPLSPYIVSLFSFVLQKKNGQTDARYNSSAPVFTVDI